MNKQICLSANVIRDFNGIVNMRPLPFDQIIFISNLSNKIILDKKSCVYVNDKTLKMLIDVMISQDHVNTRIFFKLCSIYVKAIGSPYSKNDDKSFAVNLGREDAITGIKAIRLIMREPSIKQMFTHLHSDGLKECKGYWDNHVSIGPLTYEQAKQVASFIQANSTRAISTDIVDVNKCEKLLDIKNSNMVYSYI